MHVSQKTKRQNRLTNAIKVALMSLIITHIVPAYSIEEAEATNKAPNKMIIKDDFNQFISLPDSVRYQAGSAYDLIGETSSVVSAATGPVRGHYPGIRTGASVNNEKGELRTCSSVTIHYQILDTDKDWDAKETLNNVLDGKKSYRHLKTSDTIRWYFIDKNETKFDVTNSDFISLDKLKMKYIPLEIEIQGQKISTEGMSIGYEITPWTMIGSVPRTSGELPDVDFDNSESLPLQVKDLTQMYLLRPDSFVASDEVIDTDDAKRLEESDNYLNYPGLRLPLGDNFILNPLVIKGDLTECVLPQEGGYHIEIYKTIDDKEDDKETVKLTEPLGDSNAYVNKTYAVKITQRVNIGNDEFEERELSDTELANLKNNIIWELWDEKGENVLVRTPLLNETIEVDSALEEKIRVIMGNETNIQARLSNGSTQFRTQKTNEDALYQHGKNKSEQGLRLRALLITAENMTDH